MWMWQKKKKNNKNTEDQSRQYQTSCLYHAISNTDIQTEKNNNHI